MSSSSVNEAVGVFALGRQLHFVAIGGKVRLVLGKVNAHQERCVFLGKLLEILERCLRGHHIDFGDAVVGDLGHFASWFSGFGFDGPIGDLCERFAELRFYRSVERFQRIRVGVSGDKGMHFASRQNRERLRAGHGKQLALSSTESSPT